ncbi:UDP-N-acetylmuramoyl-tripeptide--D-alanyl-D-alanine ligase [Gulosibacter chungangensis]|uniref:UDP-N-acetylmuramoyl-tripeptide--D-alanyl-D-alanine ligase n=1 Tax=Gulosibacter chungangensis TaxID=979746 RepID=A0A7J5BCW0_9MICO|nr:UDP-N-acetylmuramoyl-tripeptide--D-alanyl-D-alanine ligase [Gulosibacter chungangensis]KAB1643979.1 UDP-N-acetylmuramoyl-tripeptide--D-alanyl-D-alanine ligase [Gulosibacter chungangensis]
MIPMTLREIAERIDGRLLLAEGTGEGDIIRGLSDTDSRKIGTGDIFFAKPGEVTDGHLYAPKAVENGAALAVVERELELGIPQIVVDDVVAALGQLATEVVERVRQHGRMRVVAVTGSNGKTTTKNLLKAIFERHGNVVAPIASFNNEVGAPTTFLQVTEETDTLIAEMGASKVGEIRYLTNMARPDIGIVLMVGLAHAGEFGGIEMIEKAKAEMVEALGEGGVAVLNADDPRVVKMAQKAPGEVVWFGRGESAQIRATDVEVSQQGTRFVLHSPNHDPVSVEFSVIGEHHVMNALAATAAAHAAGIPITDVVEVLTTVTRAERWRMEVLTREPITVINDAYNANPNSMAAALRTLAQIANPGQRTVAVLGQMSELGDQSVFEHDKLGELAVRLGVSQTVVIGRDARPLYLAAVAQGSWDNEATFAEDADEAFDFLRGYLQPGDLVLVKSSNSAGLRMLGDRLGDYVKGTLA